MLFDQLMEIHKIKGMQGVNYKRKSTRLLSRDALANICEGSPIPVSVFPMNSSLGDLSAETVHRRYSRQEEVRLMHDKSAIRVIFNDPLD